VAAEGQFEAPAHGDRMHGGDHRLVGRLDRGDDRMQRGFGEALGVLNSLMSAPPENALPAPVITIALTALSAMAFFRPSNMPERVA